ncbi:MAG: MBL fold metallo-hydrolase [Pseudomonadota bacterium]
MISQSTPWLGASVAVWALGLAPVAAETCTVELIVLGAGQDGGAPQIGNFDDRAWRDPELRLLPSSVAVVDHESGERFLFDASPAITEQLAILDGLVPPQNGPLGLSGVFLTHAHMGHYAGLIQFGFEAASTDDLRVFAMPRMGSFLKNNGPWSQLVEFDNIDIVELAADDALQLNDDLSVTPLLVPHRDEFSETVGFVINAGKTQALYLPDIDRWTEWERDYGRSIAQLAEQSTMIFVDATFFDDGELPGRDMSKIPHPRVRATMELIEQKAPEAAGRVHFIHYNHTNPIRDPQSEQSQEVLARGFNIARRGDRHCLTTAAE